MAEISKIRVEPTEPVEYRLDLTKTEAKELVALLRNGIDPRTYEAMPTLRVVRDGLLKLVEPRALSFSYTAQARGY